MSRPEGVVDLAVSGCPFRQLYPIGDCVCAFSLSKTPHILRGAVLCRYQMEALMEWTGLVQTQCILDLISWDRNPTRLMAFMVWYETELTVESQNMSNTFVKHL